MFDEFYGNPVLFFQEQQSVLNFVLFFDRKRFHEFLKVSAVCLYLSFHAAKIQKGYHL
jgi:hypothetical protein